MRIDLFLKKCRLIKHRSEAKQACENGIVRIDGQPVKPGKPVKIGQRIAIDFTDRYLEIEVLDLPRGNVPKTLASQFYRIVKDEKKEVLDF